MLLIAELCNPFYEVLVFVMPLLHDWFVLPIFYLLMQLINDIDHFHFSLFPKVSHVIEQSLAQLEVTIHVVLRIRDIVD